MYRTSIAAAIAIGTWVSPLGLPAFSGDDTDERFGTAHFATSCNETAQRRFDRAMRYQHSFWYQSSKELFEEVLKADPGCAIAFWGIALSLLCNPHAPPPPGNLPLGLAALHQGQGVGALSRRERDYIDALGVFYTDFDKIPHAQRVQAYLKAMAALAQKYPDVHIQLQIARAWVLHAEGKFDDAIKAMSAAADAEDRTEKHPVTPGALTPAREHLGQMLLERAIAREALSAFEATLRKKRLDDKAKAKEYFQKLTALANNADTLRPDLAVAHQFLATY